MGPLPGRRNARAVKVETRNPYGVYPPAKAACAKASCASPPIPTAFCCAGGVLAVLVRVPMGSGITMRAEPAVVD